MGSLGADLASLPQRERAGERTQQRFDYQALWGMALLFRRHDEEGDYAVIFEFHDDIALVDNPVAPAEVRFFQVKTKDKGAWKLSDLTRRKGARVRNAAPRSAITEDADIFRGDQADAAAGEPGSSILGRMFHNVRQFGDRVAAATLVSNAPCDLHLDGIFDFRQCAPATFDKLIEAVREEFRDATEQEVSLLGFERADLSLQDSSIHAKGKLHEFVQRHVGAEQFPLEALFRLVIEECRKRSKFTGPIPSFGDIVRLKGITRSDVQGWLDTVRAAVRVPSWEELNSQLVYSLEERLALRAAWSVYRAEALNQADEALRSIRRAIRERIGEGLESSEFLAEVVDAIFKDVENIGREYITPFQPARLRAMIIYELYTKDPT